MSSTDSLIEQLKEFATCDISDALCALGHKNGGFLPDLNIRSPRNADPSIRIVGPAYTVSYVLLDDPTPAMAGHYIDHVPSGGVLFISAPRTISNAVYGGMMSTRAKYLGAAGTVVDGRIRDIEEHWTMSYPVFSRGQGTAPPAPRAKVVGTNVPVTVGSGEDACIVDAGDIVVGDVNGVVVLKRDDAEKVLESMKKRTAMDAKIEKALAEGAPFLEAQQKYRPKVTA